MRPKWGSGAHHQSYQSLEEAVADGCRLCTQLQRKLEDNDWDRDSLFEVEYLYNDRDLAAPTLSLLWNGPDSWCKKVWDLLPVRQDNVQKKYLAKANYYCTSSTGSKESLVLANLWLSTCIRDHTQCDRPQPSSLRDWRPTRLLHVGNGVNGIRLCEGQTIPVGVKYTTLSHCWGKGLKRKNLTRHNIDAWTKAVPDCELMQTFKDAAEVTRKLGVEYLWIDSLCIIQDSEADWLHESSLMCNVYKYSHCTIAATAAANDDSGCFADRDPQLDMPIQFDFSNFAPQSPLQSVTKDRADKVRDTTLKGLYEVHKSGLWRDEIGSSPLFARAWVLQERLLSPRLLHFAKSQLYWECSELRACENYPRGSSTDGYIPLGHDTASLFKVQRELSEKFTTPHSSVRLMLQKLLRWRIRRSKSLDREVLEDWSWIVEAYTNSRLTQERDKLIAISAVAREMKPIMQCRYLAGLWENDLVKQLCWFTTEKSASVILSRPTAYRAPSWSWASVERKCLIRRFCPANPIIEIRSAHIELAGEDEMGPVEGGYLDVQGRLFKLDPQGKRQGVNGEYVLFEGLSTGLELLKDDSRTEIDGQLYCMILLISVGDDSVEISGLALQRLGSSNIYQRTGLVRSCFGRNPDWEDPIIGLLGDIKTGDDDTCTSVRNDSGRKTIRIV
ncbi:MAG: hypothetical protein Q9208_006001 [Pyrenodesmia sp. 3 TL-2023]